MEKLLKAIGICACTAIIVIIAIVSSLPKDRNSTVKNDDIDIEKHIKALNYDLPRNIGTIGSLESITYEDNMICYNMSIFGDPDVIDFYKENYATFKTVMLYSFALLNGQNNNATRLAEFEAYKGIGTKWVIKTSNNRSISWQATGKELLEFIKKNECDPTDIVADLLDFQIELTNYQLKTVSSNALAEINEDGIYVKSISHMNNDVIMTYILDESLYIIDNLIENSKDKQFIEELAYNLTLDPDMQELINLISISHSNIIIRYQGNKSSKYADLKITYEILKKYSQVPHLH